MGKDLKGKVVVLVGASSGIGRAAALEFARNGAKLVLAARRENLLAELAVACENLNTTATYIKTDVTNPEEVQQLAHAAMEFGGKIDVWINNAGIGAVGEFAETPIAAHDHVIKTNLMGHIHGAHAVLPYFKQQGYGILINTISVGAWVPEPYTVAYAASKFGLRGFSGALRGELLNWPDIQICDVFPAFIDTPGFQHAANYIGKKIKPIPPVYEADRVAKAMVELAYHPKERVTVGGSGYLLRGSYTLFPGLTRRILAGIMENYFSRAKPAPVADNGLFEPTDIGSGISGGWLSPEDKQRTTVLTGVALLAGAAAGLYLAMRKS
ncbi:SDR family oxidoreductase [Pontibacter sp. SGAir0037]|uniref:SDR family oxidoreductase n=1 Tax=Pontibacter sp. SGAir0037 TaxID=2571030 RepID=UPI0010CCF4DF|nr:SDR family oxidoreductase [Pontibacter sp. SGAir0037]QCR21434.1 short-chain dehydrogenase [Pontibacter sp. SGAir0037]